MPTAPVLATAASVLRVKRLRSVASSPPRKILNRPEILPIKFGARLSNLSSIILERLLKWYCRFQYLLFISPLAASMLQIFRLYLASTISSGISPTSTIKKSHGLKENIMNHIEHAVSECAQSPHTAIVYSLE